MQVHHEAVSGSAHLPRWRRLDTQLFRWMGAGHGSSPWLLQLARHLSNWSWAPMAATLLVAAFLEGDAWPLLQCLLIASLVQVLSKQCASRWNLPRPFQLGLSPNHLGHSARAGFPSTHAMVMGTVFGFMALALPSGWILASLAGLALATAWARVYAGAHFPLDVLAGLGLGALAGLLAGWALAL